jgi:aminoglycoside phosphotransferase (APT) family kinase protein
VGIADLLRFVNARHGTAFALRGYLEGGTRGAWEVVAPGGRRVVLKRGWGEHLGRIRPVVEALRARGYPTPRFLLGGRAPDGGSYHVQEWMPGAPVERLTPELLRQIVELIELQADLRPDTDQDWSAYVRAVVFEGEAGWAATLRAHSGATAALLDGVERATRPLRATRLPVADAVHGDLGAYNVLAAGGRVTAVVDLASVGRGTRAVDLAILLGQGYADLDAGQRDALYARMRAAAGPPGAAVCAAYQIINLVAYAIAEHDPASVPDVVDRGRRMLADLRRL